jgi:hypothetical protein
MPVPDQKPIIVLVNPDDGARAYWKQSLEAYLKEKRIEAEIRDLGTMNATKSNFIETSNEISQILHEGRRPSLLITDAVLDNCTQGGHIAGALRRGEMVLDQDERWPEGRNLPVVVLSGGLSGIAPGYENTFSGSCICLHEKLIDPTYKGPGKYVIEEFKRFVDRALQMRSPDRPPH